MWEYGVVRAKLKAICMRTWALYTKNSHSSFAYNTSVPSKPYQLWQKEEVDSFKTLSTLARKARGHLQNPINSGELRSDEASIDRVLKVAALGFSPVLIGF